MEKNRKGKDEVLVVKKISVMDKIANFFKNMLKRKNKEDSERILEVSNNEKRKDFQSEIKIERDLEEERLLNLKKQFENNIITEEEISEEDKIELKGLYYMQILKSKTKIKIYKEMIMKNKMQTE